MSAFGELKRHLEDTVPDEVLQDPSWTTRLCPTLDFRELLSETTLNDLVLDSDFDYGDE